QIQSLGGNLYFTTNDGEIGRIAPTGQITLNFAPGGADLAVGAAGNLWTALGNTVRRITPNGTVSDFAIPTPGAFAGSITASPDPQDPTATSGLKSPPLTRSGGSTRRPAPSPNSNSNRVPSTVRPVSEGSRPRPTAASGSPSRS